MSRLSVSKSGVRPAAQQYRKLKTLLNRLDKPSKTILRYQAELAESPSARTDSKIGVIPISPADWP
jgi:hypothetical protein